MVGTCKWDNKTFGTIKCGEVIGHLGTVSFSRRTLLHGASKSKKFGGR